jgi:hypothetical protein
MNKLILEDKDLKYSINDIDDQTDIMNKLILEDKD